MSAITFQPAVNESDIGLIADLAREIWYEYYVQLIGRAQVDYMVSKFQTVPAMLAQLRSGYEYFLVQQQGQSIGYTSIQAQSDNSLFISKLYLLRSCRGSGTGRVVMTFIEDVALKRGIDRLWLTVNKGNPAVKMYERLGFQIAAAIVLDIGNGFVMDDFRMEKSLQA